MKNNLQLSKEDLMITIMCLQKAHNNIKDEELNGLVHGVIAILLNTYFSDYNSELIWQFAINSKSNKFNSFTELYDYLSDPYSDIVHKYAGVDLDTLIKMFPNEKMFRIFKECIKNRNTENTEDQDI